MDSHGNMTKGFIKRTLEAVGGPSSKIIPFVPDDGGRPLILQQIRKATRKRPAEYKVLLIGTPTVAYKPQRFDFGKVGRTTIARTFDKALKQRLSEALASAR